MLVLIVEDDPLVAMDLEEIIVAHHGAEVITSASLESASKSIHRPLDFAFLDVHLGDGTTHRLAADLRRKNVPFAFVSGSPQSLLPDDLRTARFVAKPFSSRDIIRALDHARDAVRQPLAETGNVTVNRVVPPRLPASSWPFSRPARA